MITKNITYFGKTRTLACDGNCHKAWGVVARPKVQLSDDDEDDIYYLSDNELGIAPEDPGTYEGGDGKPYNSRGFPNKWCARQCERAKLVELGEEIKLFDFSNRLYNKPFKHLNEKI